ncbi:hypothetical protein B0O80DRAFT_492502 [Mortierella sp. GBAus27b]|nr:hypothetical protein BGX31_006820 [Mortierella sp. GBA43]KAI8363353.1 hypothetical protein B0O80DRAFT_492502 [Mortierella sp. GBAus27b]
MEAPPPPLPVSEEDFLKSVFALRFRQRVVYFQSLIRTHGEDLLPLLEELLATQPAINSIPISRPPKNESELNADGGNPAPEIDSHALPIPQTNASARYIQRNAGLTMATNLAQRGSQRAIALLLANLNHPYQPGKKSLIQCLAEHAEDQDILAAVVDSAPYVRDSLVAALTEHKRKGLVCDILGKPRPVPKSEKTVPLTTRLRRELEQAKEYDRERIWNSFLGVLDVVNQPGSDTCEPGEKVKDVILTLQESFPPLHPWDSSNPERRSPKLALLIENYLVPFLLFDTERTIRILEKTSWQASGNNQYNAFIPKNLHFNRKASKFWCRQDKDYLLREYLLGLMAVGNGEFVKRGSVFENTIFRCCRGPTVDRLIRAALALLETDEFKTYSASEHTKISRLDNILKFAVAGISNLITRVYGCSTKEDRPMSTSSFHESLRGLLTALCSSACTAIRIQEQSDVSFTNRFSRVAINPLLQKEDVDHQGQPTGKPCRIPSFPPLGEQLFELIQGFAFGAQLRKGPVVFTIVERLLDVLAPRDMSVYNIPNDGLQQPYSSIPAWSNEAVFQTCIAECLDKKDNEVIHLDNTWINHFSTVGPSLTSSQRDKVVEWIMALPSFRPLIGKNQGVAVAPMLDKLCTNTDLRHQLVFPFVFPEKKDKDVDLGDNRSSWAAYVDIRIPEVRALLAKETTKPAFEDRLKWFNAILKATRLAKGVKEWILTLKWLLPKIRNEIHPNLMQLAPLLMGNDFVSRQYLDNATLDEANELATMYLAMDAQNASAVTPVSLITYFIDAIAREALWRFADRPSHPFYHLGTEIRWRRRVSSFGEATALDGYQLQIAKPTYPSAVSERDEEDELRRRQLVAKEKDALKTEGGPWGAYVIAEGNEEDFVQGKLHAFYSRWLTVKEAANPDVEGDDLQSFKDAQKPLWRKICRSLHEDLGWRWKNSPTLVSYMEETLEFLTNSPTETYGPDKVFSWTWENEEERDAAAYVERVYEKYTDQDWLRENTDKLAWFTRFRNLRLESTYYTNEVEFRVSQCVKNGRRDNVRYEQVMLELLNKSPSAIHLLQVREFVSEERPDLLSDEQIRMTKGIAGVFNQVESPGPWNLFLRKPSVLDPHQCVILKARHLLGMTDSSTPFQTRVEHAQAFVNIPTTTVEDVANALCTPALPSRIIEALLMYLPTLGEPGTTLPLLLAPVYIQSHLARTSIHAVENALKCVPMSQAPDFILPLFPPPDQKQQKVTVQKEGVRLACASMRLATDPKISTLMTDLLARSSLHNDVRVVVLQSLLGLLVGSEAREERYKDVVEWIWKSLSDVARSVAHKKSGVAYVLLAVNPQYKYDVQAPRLTINGLFRNLKVSATLSNLAQVSIPEYLITRYVDDILVPMSEAPTGEDAEDTNLTDIRVMALQTIGNNEGWVTHANASRMAKFWRKEATSAPLKGDKDQLWILSARGMAHCVGKEVEGALASGQEGNTAWNEIVGLVQDQVDAFLDKKQLRSLRRMGLQRINDLSLATNFITQYFEKAKKAGAFTGDDLDLSRPLVSKAMVSVTWNIALQREIAVFKPQDGLTQDQINEEVFKILLRIADYTNRHLSATAETVQWVGQNLLSKFSDNKPLRSFIVQKLINPCDALIDWVHLNDVTENVMLSSKKVLSLKEISQWIEKLACQDTVFYWTKRKGISDLLTGEVQTTFAAHYRQMTAEFVSSVKEVLSPIVKRAQAANWIKGPDATIVRNMLRTHAEIMCTAFPKEIGAIIHHNIVHAVEQSDGNGFPAQQFLQDIYGLADYGWKATISGYLGDRAHLTGLGDGISPATVLIIDACLNNRLGELDLTPFVASNNLPLDVLRGQWFSFQRTGDPKTHTTQDEKNPCTLKELEARWKKTMTTYGSYFKPMEQVVEAKSGKASSPDLRQAYRDIVANLISRNPKILLMRPYEYLEYLCLVLTSPDTTLTTSGVARNLYSAFVPVKGNARDGYVYAWAPPLSLGLDLAEYLLHKIRDDAASEGEREARLIEQMTAMFLNSWMNQIVKSDAGKALATAEDLKTLEARYLALVEELCEEGSGGQSMGLVLDDFVPQDPATLA